MAPCVSPFRMKFEREEAPDHQEQKNTEKTFSEAMNVENDPDLSWLVPVPTFVANAPPEEPPVIEGLLHPGEVMFLASQPNQGKTLCTFEMARGVAHGGGVFGGRFQARQGRVLIIEQEHRVSALVARLRRADLEDNANVRIAHRSEFMLHKPREIAKLGRALQKWKPLLCILDPLADLHDADENNKQEMGRVLIKMWKLVAMSPQTAFAYCHHENKASGQAGGSSNLGSMRGSGSLGGKVDVAFSVKTKSKEGSKLSIELTQTKNRDGAMLNPITFSYDFNQEGAAAWSASGEATAGATRDAGPSLRQLVFDAIKEHGSFPSIEALRVKIGRRKGDVSAVLNQLKAERKVINSRSGGWRLAKALPDADPGNDEAEDGASKPSSSSGDLSER